MAIDKVAMLTTLTGETNTTVLSTYLTLAEHKIMEHAYPYGNAPAAMPEKYDLDQVQIAEYMLNKRGAEGQVTHNENGVQRNWENGEVPYQLLRRITPQAVVL